MSRTSQKQREQVIELKILKLTVYDISEIAKTKRISRPFQESRGTIEYKIPGETN